MKNSVLLVGMLLFHAPPVFAACSPLLPAATPLLNPSIAFIRQGYGEWGKSRPGGATHDGVDLIYLQAHTNNDAYAIKAWKKGIVAYAGLNTAPCKDKNGKPQNCDETTGYGNVVVIDHGNNEYSLYAHISFQEPFTSRKNVAVKRGKEVCSADIIGYTSKYQYDLWFESTGNAARHHLPTVRNQMHFAILAALSGRSGDSIGSIKMADGTWKDPTPILTQLGFKKVQVD